VEQAAAVFVGSSSTIKVVLGHARAVNKRRGYPCVEIRDPCRVRARKSSMSRHEEGVNRIYSYFHSREDPSTIQRLRGYDLERHLWARGQFPKPAEATPDSHHRFLRRQPTFDTVRLSLPTLLFSTGYLVSQSYHLVQLSTMSSPPG
jgi:hypothetical protein